MKKNKFFTALVALVALTSLSGCDKESGDVLLEEEKVTYVDNVDLPTDSIDLYVGDTYKLSPTFSSNKETFPTLSFVSTNTDVATVDSEGNIEAKNIGKTTINVGFGDAHTSCEINVGLFDAIPVIKFDNLRSNSIKIEKGTSIDLSAKVLFNGKYYESDDLKLKLSSNNYGSKSGNVFTATRDGTLTATWSGTFFGYTLEEVSVDIEIVTTIDINIRKVGDPQELQSVVLFTYAKYGDLTYENELNYEIEIIEARQKRQPTSVELINNNENAVALDLANNKITTSGNNKSGTAELKIVYVNNSGVSYTKYLPISVDYSFVPYQNEDIERFVINDGTFNVNKIFASFDPIDRKIVVAKKPDGTVLPVDADGKISGIEEMADTVQTLYVGNGKILKEVRFTVITGIIRTVEDLEMFRLCNDTEANYASAAIMVLYNETILSGTYILENDIDAKGYVLKDRGRLEGNSRQQYKGGFHGIFDGQGHTIKNLVFNRSGLFTVMNYATVKNVGFENAKFVGSDIDNSGDSIQSRCALAAYIANSYIENVYIHADKLARGNCNDLICSGIDANTVIKNCLFVLDEDVPDCISKKYFGYGMFACILDSAAVGTSQNETFLKNCYFVGKTPLSRAQEGAPFTFKNYIFDAKGVDWPTAQGSKPTEYTQYYFANPVHYLSYSDMENGSNDYSSFDTQYWTVTGNNTLTWKQN